MNRIETSSRLVSSFLFSFGKNVSSKEKIAATIDFSLYFAIEQKKDERRRIEFLEIRIEEENRESGDAPLVSRGYHDRPRAERSIKPGGGGGEEQEYSRRRRKWLRAPATLNRITRSWLVGLPRPVTASNVR